MNNKKYKFFLFGFLSFFFFFSFFQTSQAGFFDWFDWFGLFKKRTPQKSVEIIPIVIKENSSSKRRSSVLEKINDSLSSPNKSSQIYSKTLNSKSFLPNQSSSSHEPIINSSAGKANKLNKKEGLINGIDLIVYGRAQPFVVDPLGRKSGVNPNTFLLEYGIPDSFINMDGDGGSVNTINPINGTYTVYLRDGHKEENRLILQYIDANNSVRKEYLVFNHAKTTSFTFTIDSSSKDKLAINHTPLSPMKLKADVINSGGLKTKLTWEGNNESAVKSYNIYSRYDDEPYLKLIGNTTNTHYDTDHLWAKDSSIREMIYVVSALKANGEESFLSDMVVNNDRDHDGLKDEKEVSIKTDLYNPDTDGDKLYDGEEYIRGTNPLIIDTDGDGYSDYEEMKAVSDPLDKDSIPKY